ncbi:DUF4388 domain-containing protein [Gloeocapsa sp. PCC 73106]|uniref:DUF4388 domain-containing protein n=1 Tax=Gloeocapsa sp. PCC 73106 TaxID=102232 RepID=UPI0002ACBF04|nr:DUF4388 domain-containing protein [Gloeocapsa sp. PCC 73106]ELR98468.1 hypothetical protein GLO73106DRAFT_00023010 [Gloeocapsa sp. PCC 73106]
MAITGRFVDFSLGELFRFLDEGHKTGLLTVKPDSTLTYYIWSHQGRIVATADRLDGSGLISLMRNRKIVLNLESKAVTELNIPLGLSLKAQNLLDAEQLKMLFAIQVMRTVCSLFTFPNAWFEFNSQENIPLEEMTGLSAPATEITLAGLRTLKDWSALTEKLPSSTSSVIKKVETQAKFRLNLIESQLWELSDGRTPLSAIAQKLDLPLDKLQQTAFCLIVIGLAEEMPMAELIKEPDLNVVSTEDISSNLSQSFLESLVNFLDHV